MAVTEVPLEEVLHPTVALSTLHCATMEKSDGRMTDRALLVIAEVVSILIKSCWLLLTMELD
jgi:hypothetical protein